MLLDVIAIVCFSYINILYSYITREDQGVPLDPLLYIIITILDFANSVVIPSYIILLHYFLYSCFLFLFLAFLSFYM